MNAMVDTKDSELMDVLRTSIFPGATDASIRLAMSYCRAAHLDIIQKPVHIVPMWDKNAGAMRDVVMPGIGLYRTQAARSGEYAGQSEPEFGEDVTENIGGADITYPKWCKVTVYRLVNGQPVPFTAKEFWRENYAPRGGKEKSIAPNPVWTKRPYGQIAKCAEAQALRKAFPEFGAAPTAEEMEGKEYGLVIDQDATDLESLAADHRLALSDAGDAETLKAAFASAYRWAQNAKRKDLMAEFKATYDAGKLRLEPPREDAA